LPIGLAHGMPLRGAVAAGEVVTWADVVADEAAQPVRIRREMERLFAAPTDDLLRRSIKNQPVP
jgi:predicted homoserine dehydrogenase-like protein